MARTFPRRNDSHQKEEASQRYFQAALPRGWVCEKPGHDYGVDLRVDIFEDEDATGLELLVQLKATDKPTEGDNENVTLKTSTFHYLQDKLQVVMVVKFVEASQEAYWILLKDVPPPNDDHKSFTISIPKANRLSSINWKKIQDHVRKVTDTKLAATRRMKLNAAN